MPRSRVPACLSSSATDLRQTSRRVVLLAVETMRTCIATMTMARRAHRPARAAFHHLAAAGVVPPGRETPGRASSADGSNCAMSGQYTGTVGPSVRSARCPRVALIMPTSGVVTLLRGEEGEQCMGGAEMQVAQFGVLLRDRGWMVSFLVSDAAGQAEECEHEGFRFLTACRAHHTEQGRRRLLMRIPGVRFWVVNVPLFMRALRKADADVYLVRGASSLLDWRRSSADATTGPLCSRWPATQTPEACSAGTAQRCPPSCSGMDCADRTSCSCSIRNRRTYSAPAPVRTASFCPTSAAFPRRRHTRHNGDTVLWVGSIRPVKRPNARPRYRPALPGTTFRFIYGTTLSWGDTLTEQFLRRAREDAQRGAGRLCRSRGSASHLREAKVLLHTSAAGREGFPNVFLEAWAHGVPVVCCFNPAGLVSDFGLGWWRRTPGD